MGEREIQKILYAFSGGFFLAGMLMVSLGNSGYSISIFGFTVLILGMASVGPSTIKTWGAKWGGDGGHIGFDRYQPTEPERKLALKLAEDKPSPKIEKEGKEYIKEAEERPPEKRSPEDYMALATEKWRAKDYGAGLADVFSGLALNPDNIRIKASLIHRKASIFHSLGLWNQAEKYLKEAIEVDPGFPWLYNGMGSVYLEQRKFKEAEEEYKKAIELDQNFAIPHYNLGIIYRKQGKLEEAKREYEEALKLDPKLSVAKENLEKLKREMEKEK
jgi:tetratricopeptide (TPR) repeat protein